MWNLWLRWCAADRRDKRDLVFGAPAGFATDPFAAHVSVVHQDLAAPRVLRIALSHCLHQFVLNPLGGRKVDSPVLA